MRVALLSGNAPRHNAVGNHIAEKVRFFQERGAEVRVFVQDARRLHPAVQACCALVPEPRADGPVWDYLGVTPPDLWPDQHREGLEQSVRQRGFVWCADHALTTSQANRRELLEAT